MSTFALPQRAERARELHQQGKKVIGYFCCYTPVEMITAAGLVPYRLTGTAGQPLAKVDRYLETVICPFIRSVFEMRLSGDYDFLDGLVMGNMCDTINFAYTAFEDYWKPAFSHFLDVPHKITPVYFRSEFGRFGKALADYSNIDISDEALKQATLAHNRNRTLQRELYDLRKSEPPLILASDALNVTLCNLGLPVEEGNVLIENTIAAAKAGEVKRPGQGVRLLVWGSQLDSPKILQSIEESGANVVIDDTCTGYRNFRRDIQVTPDPLDGLTTYYADQVCGRTIHNGIEDRFDHLKALIQDFKVDGAILYLLRYCDINGFEVPLLSSYLKDLGVPSLTIEDDYSGALAPVKTRIQAFVEMLEQR